MISKKVEQLLSKHAKNIRIYSAEMSYRAKSAHLGGALSCVEILTALYFCVMKVNPDKPEDKDRDRLIFSKAHDAKVLYATLCERGYFSSDLLLRYETNDGLLPGHSTRHCAPGVEASAGSLGHGLPIATGIAYAGKMDKKQYQTFAILSDGECDEGSTWEAILFAGHHQLNRLTVIVDYNKLQGFGYTKDILNLEPFADKWRAFGWETIEIDGHNFNDLIAATKKTHPLMPKVIIAHTIKGYGGPKQHVNKISSQYKPPTEEELNEMINRLK